MTYQHKTAITSLITSLIVYSIYAFIVIPIYLSGGFAGAEGARALGWAVLAVLGAAIIVNIFATIVFNIIHAIVTRQPKPSFVIDERDRLFERQSLTMFLYIAGGGFVLAMLLLSQGASWFTVVHVILLGFVSGDFVANILRHQLYRQGQSDA